MSTPKKKAKENASTNDRGQNVQVFVRCRPLNGQEISKSHSVVEIPSSKDIVVKGNNVNVYSKGFQFDRVFGPGSSQFDVFTSVVDPLITQVLQGYNCTVFAYGQTGTGKTYTMEGYEDKKVVSTPSWDSNSNSGIIPQAVCQIFDEFRTCADTEFSIRVSFLELYNEEIFDLLSPTNDTSKLRLYEDSTKKGSVIIQGLEEVQVRTKSEIFMLLEKGGLKRKTAETLMNANSSRSHTVFTVTVHIKEACLEGEEVVRVGKLHLVDLAGSENVARSGASGGRAREAGSINQSLLTLGRVITCLVERTPHIPYRESKLTRLLQDSLGGKTKTSIIATISPAFTNIEETLSTLDYAQRAKNITNRPELNQKLSKGAVLKEYTEEIERLRQNLFRAREGEGVYLAQENYQEMIDQIQAQELEIKEMIGEMRALKQEMDNQIKVIEECEQKLEGKKVQLKRETSNLEKAEAVLDTAKKELQETAKERDVQIHLVDKMVETETKLGQEARKLLVVCDESAKDEVEVHEKLARVRKVEEENQELKESFLAKVEDKLNNITQVVQTFQVEHKTIGEDVMKKVREGLESNTEALQRIAERLVSITTDGHKAVNEIKSDVNQGSEASTKVVEAHKDGIVSCAQTLEDKCNEYDAVTKDKFLKEILEELQCEQQMLESMDEQISKSCKDLQINFESMAEMLTEHIEEVRDEVLACVAANSIDLTEISAINRKTEESLNVMKTAFEALMSTYKGHQQLMEKNQRENVNLIEKVANLCTKTSTTVVTKEKNHAEKRSNVLAEIKLKSDQQLETIKLTVAQCKEKNAHEQKIKEKFEESQTRLLENNSQIVKETQDRTDTFLRDITDTQNKTSGEIAKKKSSLLHNLEKDKENVEQLINQNTSQLEKRFARTSTEIESLDDNCNRFKEKHHEDLKQLEAEVIDFVTDEYKKNVVTGRTPVPKERSYPRTLSATSPHQRIIERFNRNYAIPTLSLPSEEFDVDSVISRSTRNRSTGQTSDISVFTSLGGSGSECIEVQSDQEDHQELFKVPKKPGIYSAKKTKSSTEA